ncbi:MAG: energy-coupling factor ABC transporter permease [Gallionellaceae bacterium]|nr:energy-coupling factor ABC transporter permease [Gallionellaceae bacterium]
MHIEPGYISAVKIAAANIGAAALFASQARHLVLRPQLIVRTLMAALFFSVFMESFFMHIGPSELHFIGAMPIYLLFGFVPTLLGFGLGLLLQGLLFHPTDLIHLGVNALSLAVPLVALHATLGKRLGKLDMKTILKLDAVYYAGVALMVGFWLSVGEAATPFSAWLAFAASYLAIVACEPLLTFAAVKLMQRHAHRPLVRLCFDLRTTA